jgi:hypothetical protein
MQVIIGPAHDGLQDVMQSLKGEVVEADSIRPIHMPHNAFRSGYIAGWESINIRVSARNTPPSRLIEFRLVI